MCLRGGHCSQRVKQVGDIHGDFNQTQKVLRMAGLVDKDLQWIGGPNTDFVQTGDVVDRGPDTIPLYQMLVRLYNESLSSPHGVYPLLGNHEIMNLSGDLRFVHQQDTTSFGSPFARANAWSAQGWIGAQLRGPMCYAALLLDGTVFVHGGITPVWAQQGVDNLNARVCEAVRDGEWKHPVFAREAPLRYRGYALDPEWSVCGELQRALHLLGVSSAKRMVVGHTVQKGGKIRSRCGGAIYLIDVGITKQYGSNCAALEIVGDKVTALYCVEGNPDEAFRVDMTPRDFERDL
ncbi:Metallo-dependent phosphatase-like protein [Chytriomyces sp. MP71]|nr:Metallo-dependent phosphatase-like protein [Chytriomyces sp. MP71]